ncbi:hypothetical protein [Thalassotalea sp. PLHSN55]|uniref:hypothetical protein n=1 Tax=Thalassotalea sp. PLHSN55 TaxID=3435888 RepID=UPI003F825080
MSNVALLAQQAIKAFEQYFAQMHIKPVVHFELEGAYQPIKIGGKSQHNSLNFTQINQQLANLNIDGELKPEYWQNQWEYVSLFNGQSPLTEANNLAKAIKVLPTLFQQQGINSILIKPVIWSGDQSRLFTGSQSIFSADQQAVHIPNAVQINISAQNQHGENIIPHTNFGEILQQRLIATSYSCCLLFLPEEEAFERLRLKNTFQLDAELCSPNNISGGHQGSIALYKELGKHNQPMGQVPLVYDSNHNILSYNNDWQATARVEHRLGASSMHYCPYVNICFALANLADALDIFLQPSTTSQSEKTTPEQHREIELPRSLYQQEQFIGAVELFQQDTWFARRINQTLTSLGSAPHAQLITLPNNLGNLLQQAILAKYEKPQLVNPQYAKTSTT